MPSRQRSREAKACIRLRFEKLTIERKRSSHAHDLSSSHRRRHLTFRLMKDRGRSRASLDINASNMGGSTRCPGVACALTTGQDERRGRRTWMVPRFPVVAEALLLPHPNCQMRDGGNIMQRTRCAYFRDEIGCPATSEPGSGCAALLAHPKSRDFRMVRMCVATPSTGLGWRYGCVVIVGEKRAND